MAILPSSGFYGFISSAKKQLGQYVSTFVSGVSGWMIRNNGDAEFKSIYARDKIVTNEYIYNRIKVTEDEEIISTSGKIAYSSYSDEEESYTVGLDLREGDLNPFRANDLIQGYYHFPGNTGTVYAIQRMTIAQINEDQTMTVFVEGQSQPYPQMIIVRVGNIEDEERQAFIKISSKDNNQLFFDEINSFYALDDPNNVKMSVGKAQIGLIPAWASAIIGTFKKWFGLIADGVILRGVFVLQSSGKTIEKELEEVNETITEVETRFEIKEGQISSSVREAKEYAESANTAAGAAVDAGNAAIDAAKEANEAKIIATEKASEAIQTADGFQTTVTEVTKKAVDDAVAGSEQVIEEMVSTQVTQSAREWKVEVLNGQETVIASINADEGGILIQGEKVRITGQLLADIIMAAGLNIQDKFVVTVDEGQASVKMKASLSLPYEVIDTTQGTISPMMIDLSKRTYLISHCRAYLQIPTLKLPIPSAKYNGMEVRIYSGFRIGRSDISTFDIIIEQNHYFFYPGFIPLINMPLAISKVTVSDREIVLRCISYDFENGEGASFWYIENYNDFATTDFNQN